MVVGYVVVGEFPSFPVLEPLLAYLVSANVELPYLGRNAFEILGLIDVNPAQLKRFFSLRHQLARCEVSRPFYQVVACYWVVRYKLRQDGRFEQM